MRHGAGKLEPAGQGPLIIGVGVGDKGQPAERAGEGKNKRGLRIDNGQTAKAEKSGAQAKIKSSCCALSDIERRAREQMEGVGGI